MNDKYSKLYKTAETDEEAVARLIAILRILRVECPWDRKQTHESLTGCMLEEAYEAVDAINEKNYDNLKEELGDVLLQTLFHSLLAEEEKRFGFKDVINEECEKMIRRHPHVFSTAEAKSVDNVLEKWENIKRQENNWDSQTERLKSVPKALPALIRSRKVQERASEVGFDWDDTSDVFPKIIEETQELRKAYENRSNSEIVEELGDLLFSIVNISRFLSVNAEDALTDATDKFIRRFGRMESAAAAEGVKLQDLELKEMDVLWEKAKDLDSSGK
ncbi:MAG: nucleoside triphosphate pyrophosphohydrolase [Firmicutes bacterium]|nr:nucleoside triphosphate pyrophosphohydrolase [Bacillota bacterium]